MATSICTQCDHPLSHHSDTGCFVKVGSASCDDAYCLCSVPQPCGAGGQHEPSKIDRKICWRCFDEINPLAWKLSDAIEFARNVEVALQEVGWHVALTGGVLREGKSDKDLDLVVYPRKKRGKDCPRKDSLHYALKKLGLRNFRTCAEMRAHWRTKGGVIDQKWVEVWKTSDGKRVDVMVLS